MVDIINPMKFDIKLLEPTDLDLLGAALDCFSEVFHDRETYSANRPDADYFKALLSGDSFLCLVATQGKEVVGALAAYELKKFEQRRSELYIYDLAVYELYRRRGVATALIDRLRIVAKDRGAWVIFVQADYVDLPATRLYSKLGKKEAVLHFDLAVD